MLPLVDVVAISYGRGLPHGLLADGTVVRLVDDNLGKYAKVQGATEVTMISCSNWSCAALQKGGSVVTWAQDSIAITILLDATARKTNAVTVPGVKDVVFLHANYGGTWNGAAVATLDGQVYSWGRPTYSVTHIKTLERITQLSCAGFCVGVRDDGSIWEWGSQSPVRVPWLALSP